MNEKQLYNALLEKNGRDHQCVKAMEEAAEFVTAMSKMLNGYGDLKSVIEEIADVQIMLDQMIHFFAIENEVGRARRKKLGRQARRIVGEER